MVQRTFVYQVILDLDWIRHVYHKEPDDELAEVWTRDQAAAFGRKLISATFDPAVPRMCFYFTDEEAAEVCDRAFENVRRRMER